MQANRLLCVALVCAALCSTAAAQAQRVRLVVGSHLPPATGVERTYAATCGFVQYQLAVSAVAKSVVLHASGRPDTDLSGTTVGARLLEQDVLVDVGFNCPDGALNIFLKGVKLVDLGAPAGFRDHVSVKSDGTLSDTAPRAERVDELANAQPGVTTIPSPPPGPG